MPLSGQLYGISQLQAGIAGVLNFGAGFRSFFVPLRRFARTRAKLVTFETPDGGKVCRAHAPLSSALPVCQGASMSQSC
jgi:hypothetical protein